MNRKQAALILGLAVMGIAVPWFSVGMFFMGAAVGAYLSIIFSD